MMPLDREEPLCTQPFRATLTTPSKDHWHECMYM